MGARLWIVETADGDWKIARSTPLKEALHLCPRVLHPGIITLYGGKYVVDANRQRKIPRKKWRTGKLVPTDWTYVQLWREGDPEPIPYFEAKNRSDDITSGIMADIARSRRVRDLLRPQTDWKDIALIFAVLGMVILGVVIWQLSQRGGA